MTTMLCTLLDDAVSVNAPFEAWVVVSIFETAKCLKPVRPPLAAPMGWRMGATSYST
jgi:hypothetical protein